MENLDQKRIAQGRIQLLIGLGVLTLLRLLIAIFFSDLAEGNLAFAQFDEIYWWQIPILIVMGAGTYQGGKIVRYILAGILVVVLVLEIYLFALAGFPQTNLLLGSILAWLGSAYLLYLLMISSKTESFFLVQRAKNYGEYAVVGPAAGERSSAQARRRGSDALEEDVEVGEDMQAENEAAGTPAEAESQSPPRSGKKKKSSWEDELDLYE